MIQEKKLSILKEIFGSCFSTNGKHGTEYLFYCKKCVDHHKKKLSINLTKNSWKCWVCLESGKSIDWLVKRYGNGQQLSQWYELVGHIDFSEIDQPDIEIKQKLELPNEFISLSRKNLFYYRALEYLNSRNVTKEDILWWKMGICLEGKYKERIIIPSYDKQGELNYFVARSYTNHPIPYLNPKNPQDIIFNELFIDFNKDIVIVEGAFDAVVAKNAIPLLGSSLSEKSYLFKTIVEQCKKIYIALDPDAEQKENRIIKSFLMYGLDVYKINVKPHKDPGEMTPYEFEKRKKNACLITTESDIEYLINQ